VDGVADGARNGEGVGVWPLAFMLPDIAFYLNSILPPLGIVEEQNRGVASDVRCIEERGNASL